MKIEIEQATLNALLGRVIKAVETRNTIPALGSVLLTASGNTLTAVTTDLDVEVTSTAEATVTQEGSTTVNAATLQAIVAKLQKGKLVNLHADGFTLHVTSGRSNLSLSALPIEDFPRIASQDYAAEFQADQVTLKKMLDNASFAMSTEEARYYLNGIFLHAPEGTVRVVSTDGHRLARIDSDIEATFPDAIVPRKTVGLVKALLDEGDVSVSVSVNKIRFDFGHSVIVSKLIESTFPDYSRITPKDHKTEVKVSAADVKQAAALVSLVSADKIRTVRVKVTDELVTLTVRNGAEVGVEEIDAEVSGEFLEAGFNSKYLADILQACNGDNALIRFNSPGDPIVVQPEEDEKSLYVCMPLRI